MTERRHHFRLLETKEAWQINAAYGSRLDLLAINDLLGKLVKLERGLWIRWLWCINVSFLILIGILGLHRLIILFGGSHSSESTCNAGDLGLIPGLGTFPGGGHDNPLHSWGRKDLEMTERLSTAQHSKPRTCHCSPHSRLTTLLGTSLWYSPAFCWVRPHPLSQ